MISQESTGHMLVSALMSHFSSLHVLVIIHSISSLFVSVALKLIFYYWCPCYCSLGARSYWTPLCVNYKTLKLDVLSSGRLSFIQKVWVQTLWQNTSILLKCPWANVWISTNPGPAVLLLTLYLDHSAGGRQANGWTSYITRQYSLILLNRCGNSKNAVISFVAFKEP